MRNTSILLAAGGLGALLATGATAQVHLPPAQAVQAAAPRAAMSSAPARAAVMAAPSRPAEDRARDAARKPAEMLAFAGVKAGSKVGDLIPGGGYFTRVFAGAVGPSGKVYALVPAAYAATHPDALTGLQTLAASPGYGNVQVVSWAPTAPLPEPLDVVWTSQNYHDLHNAPAGSVAGFNQAAFAMLKPGGVYVVLDHADTSGSGVRNTNTTHRIDPAIVKTEVTAAGFVFAGESTVLRNPGDPHTANVFAPAIRGKTDQFVYKFRKPAR